MKKFTALLLAAALAVSLATPAVAAALSPSVPQPLYLNGSIVDEIDGKIEVKNAMDGESVILNISPDTYMIDCVTGQPLPLKDRKTDDLVAYYGPVMTRSLPPVSNAILLILDVPQDYMPPTYGKVESLERSDNNGQVMVTFADGSMIVTIDRDTPIFPYLTRNIVTIDNIAEGSELLMWYNFVAMSFPGQATSTKTVILNRVAAAIENPPEESAPAADKEEPFVKGTDSIFGEMGIDDGTGAVSGKLPLAIGMPNEALSKAFNDTVSALFDNTVKQKDDFESFHANFDYGIYEYGVYTSVVIFASVSGGDTPSSDVATCVIKNITEEGSALVPLSELLGPNYHKLANAAVSRGIAAAGEGYFTGDDAFKQIRTDQDFYVNAGGSLVIIFDKYEIASGAAGNPEFAIPLSGVVNLTVPAESVFTAGNGVDVMVPLRMVAEAIGYSVDWIKTPKTAVLKKSGSEIMVPIGDANTGLRGLETAAVIADGSTYVPLAFIEMTLGACYLNDSGTVTVSAIK